MFDLRKYIIILLLLPGCVRIAHIDKNGGIVIDRPDLYSETAKLHEERHQAGLYHCWNNRCVMYFMDLGSVDFCTKCKAKLKKIKSRYPTTLEWLNKNFKEWKD